MGKSKRRGNDFTPDSTGTGTETDGGEGDVEGKEGKAKEPKARKVSAKCWLAANFPLKACAPTRLCRWERERVLSSSQTNNVCSFWFLSSPTQR
jgi:hypothetical protein